MATTTCSQRESTALSVLQITVVRGDIFAPPLVYGVQVPRCAQINDVYSNLHTMLALPEDIQLLSFSVDHRPPAE